MDVGLGMVLEGGDGRGSFVAWTGYGLGEHKYIFLRETKASSTSHDADLYQRKNVCSPIEQQHELNIRSIASCRLKAVNTHNNPDRELSGISSRLTSCLCSILLRLLCTYGAYACSSEKLASLGDGYTYPTIPYLHFGTLKVSSLALLATFTGIG